MAQAGDAVVRSRMCDRVTLCALFDLSGGLAPPLRLRLLRAMRALSGEREVLELLEAAGAVPWLVAQLAAASGFGGRGAGSAGPPEPSMQVRGWSLRVHPGCTGAATIRLSALLAPASNSKDWEARGGMQTSLPSLPNPTGQAEALGALHNLCQISRTRQEQAAVAGAPAVLCTIATASPLHSQGEQVTNYVFI